MLKIMVFVMGLKFELSIIGYLQLPGNSRAIARIQPVCRLCSARGQSMCGC
jgi:hypothetical protein